MGDRTVMTEFSFDLAQFNRALEKLARDAMPAAIERGLGQAGMQLMRDAAMELPTIPHKEGTLRGSGSVFVENRLIGTSEQMGPGGRPARDHSEPTPAGEKSAVVGFNTPYAAYQHEGMRADGTHAVKQYSEESAGPKFLERKMSEFREDYLGIVAENIRREIG